MAPPKTLEHTVAVRHTTFSQHMTTGDIRVALSFVLDSPACLHRSLSLPVWNPLRNKKNTVASFSVFGGALRSFAV